jgi:hypothetical protein
MRQRQRCDPAVCQLTLELTHSLQLFLVASIRGAVVKRKRSLCVQADKPLPIVKMTEKFGRTPGSKQGGVARRTFYLSQDTIRVDYHVPVDCLTNSYRIYSKEGHSHIVEMNPLAAPVGPIAQLEQFQALLQAEKDCITVRCWSALS